MAAQPSRKPISFDSPTVYQIIVQGRIDPDWSDSLEGMTISRPRKGSSYPVTTLKGVLCDQAALVGVLNTLYELHTTVLSVKRMESRE
jgi:hypothetical protein